MAWMTLHRHPNAEPRHTFEWSPPDGPSRAVVEAVADASGADPLDVDQLYDVVDPDALDSLFSRPAAGRGTQSVEFRYHGYLIVLDTDGHGYVFDGEAATVPET